MSDHCGLASTNRNAHNRLAVHWDYRSLHIAAAEQLPVENAVAFLLKSRCDALHKSLSDSEQALALEPERTKAQVEHLFREQAEASEARIQALQDDPKELRKESKTWKRKISFRYRQRVL
ncbi:hypothetical protein PsorP6_009961 [Peronosclerospora sorghi]|uniref:Uncharacterized protein n=1 Tax=Peronosclerospora sorghi TaxID=230839 RepID=A0ACC0VWI2_9STRA|nr:hypothetical protein PsorP6_009961 [Peronosclerospora sorghi]